MNKKRFQLCLSFLVVLMMSFAFNSCQMGNGHNQIAKTIGLQENGYPGHVSQSALATPSYVPINPIVKFESINELGYAIRHIGGRGKIDTYIEPYQDGEFKVVSGLADSSLISLESVNFPGSYMRHRNGEIWLDANDSSTLFSADATWAMVPGLADSSKVSLESYNFPGRYIRHRDSLLYSEEVSSALDLRTATFHKWQFNWSWVKGAVFVPTNATNEIEQWDNYDPVINDRELYYSSVYGINMVRVYLHYLVWENDKNRFLNNIEDFLTRADKYGIKVEFIFFDDVWNENPLFGIYPSPIFGVHNSRWMQSPGNYIKENYGAFKSQLQAYVQDVVNAHKSDERIAFWEIYNEPGNGQSGIHYDMTEQIIKDTRQWIKETGTNRPITSTDWTNAAKASSDFYSWHLYGGYPAPPPNAYTTLNTETMNRQGQSIPGVVDYFSANNTGFLMWEAGIGRDNCRYPWGDTKVEPATPFHGMIYPDGHPWSIDDAKAMTASDLSNSPVFNVAYYGDSNFSQLKKSSITPSIDFDLGNEFGTGSPDASVGIGTDDFSTRWTGSVNPQSEGNYTFFADGDNIIRVWVNGIQIINKTSSGRNTVSGNINLNAGSYSFKVEYVHNTGDSSLHINWQGPGFGRQVLLGSRIATIPGEVKRLESQNIKGNYIRHANFRARIDSSIIPYEDSQWKIVPGLADSKNVSIESVNYPGSYLRHRYGEIWNEQNDGTTIFKLDATWIIVPGLSDSNGFSFESYNFPGEYIRHKDWFLWRTAIKNDLDRSDATFYIR